MKVIHKTYRDKVEVWGGEVDRLSMLEPRIEFDVRGGVIILREKIVYLSVSYITWKFLVNLYEDPPPSHPKKRWNK